MLIETIKERIKVAMYAKNEIEKNVLRVILGEAQQKNVSKDEEIHKIIKKVMEGNTETLNVLPEGDSRKDALSRENAILGEMLPKTWSLMEIEAFFLNSDLPEYEQIQEAKSEGQAMGVAMKALKKAGAPVDAKDVTAFVKKAREN